MNTPCPGCSAAVRQPVRKQGGGTARIFCTPKCRSRVWARENKEKRRASVAAYDAKPEVKRRKRGDAKHWASKQPGYKLAFRLKRDYGMTVAEYQTMLHRQDNKCAGCHASFNETRPCVDHNHKTGKPRGVLCDACNTSLGKLGESLEILYRLAAYIELDRSCPVVYLVGSLRNPQVVNLGNEIRALGIECVENWVAAGPLADESWQEYSNARGRTYTEALNSREAKHVFHFDKAYLDLSDAVVLLYPVGKSGHLEFGYAVGQGKRGYILVENIPDRYDVMLQFASSPLFQDRQKLLVQLKEDLLGGVTSKST